MSEEATCKKMCVARQRRGNTALYAAAMQFKEINNKNRDLNNFTIFTNNNNNNNSNKSIHQQDGQDCLERDERAFKQPLRQYIRASAVLAFSR